MFNHEDVIGVFLLDHLQCIGSNPAQDSRRKEGGWQIASGPVGLAGPLGPPGPSPARAALLAQLVAAMQAAAAGLLAPGPGPAPPPPRVKISSPIFKGLPEEIPEAHLLRANDWMDTYNILPVNKPANFKHALNHVPREWYNSLTFPIVWNDLQ